MHGAARAPPLRALASLGLGPRGAARLSRAEFPRPQLCIPQVQGVGEGELEAVPFRFLQERAGQKVLAPSLCLFFFSLAPAPFIFAELNP